MFRYTSAELAQFESTGNSYMSLTLWPSAKVQLMMQEAKVECCHQSMHWIVSGSSQGPFLDHSSEDPCFLFHKVLKSCLKTNGNCHHWFQTQTNPPTITTEIRKQSQLAKYNSRANVPTHLNARTFWYDLSTWHSLLQEGKWGSLGRKPHPSCCINNNSQNFPKVFLILLDI